MPRKKPEHELKEMAAVLSQEARDQAGRLSQDLFPKGPPGHQTMTRRQELDMVARHWSDPNFRKTLLTRMAPPGPNGYPDPVLAQRFIDLYHDAVLSRTGVEQDVPHTPRENAGPVAGVGQVPNVGGQPPPDPMTQALAPQAQQIAGLPSTPPGVPDPTTPPPEPGPTQVTQSVTPDFSAGFQVPPGMPPPPELPEGI